MNKVGAGQVLAISIQGSNNSNVRRGSGNSLRNCFNRAATACTFVVGSSVVIPSGFIYLFCFVGDSTYLSHHHNDPANTTHPIH